MSGLVPGQTLGSISNDTFYAKGGGNSFVFTPGFGQDTITHFVVGGAELKQHKSDFTFQAQT